MSQFSWDKILGGTSPHGRWPDQHNRDSRSGRVAFDRSVWGEAFAQLSAADRDTALAPEDLERLAVAAYLVGEDEAAAAAWERTHQQLLDRGEVVRAVRSAFWLTFRLVNRGEMGRAGGWLARAHRLLDDHDLDCVERDTCWSRWRHGP